MTERELMTMVDNEIARLGIGNQQFLERHEEIIKKIEQLKASDQVEDKGQ